MKKRIQGMLRVASFAGVVVTAVSWVGVRQARSELREQTAVLEASLFDLSDALSQGKTLIINGQTMHVTTQISDQSVAVLTERFERNCRGKPGLFDAIMPGVGTIVSGDRKTESSIMCIADNAANVEGSMKEFMKERNLAAFGKFRVIRLKPAEGGTESSAAWSDGDFKLDSFLRSDVDATGSDPAFSIRPPNARRVFSSVIRGEHIGGFFYVSKDSPETVLAAYDAWASSGGWTRAETQAPTSRHYLAVLSRSVHVAAESRDGQTHVSISEGAR